MFKGGIGIQTITAAIRSYYFLLFVIALVYIVAVSSLAISSHYSFNTNAWDLGIYTQALDSTLNHGRLLYYTAELPGNPSGSLFGIHFSPFLFLLVPIYAIYQSPITLLVLRPVAITIGLIPLYLILRDREMDKRLILIFSIAYLVYPPMVASFSNFDVEVFLPAFFLFATYYSERGKLIHSYFFVVLALMVNEFVPLIVAAMSMFFFLRNRQDIVNGFRERKLTKSALFFFALLATSIIWFMLAGAIITHFNPTALSTKWEWGDLGNSPMQIITNILGNPARAIGALFNDGERKFLYLSLLLGPLAFLPLLDLSPMVMALPWLGASLLSINPSYYSIGTQYPAFVSPFIFLSAVNGAKKLVSISGRRILGKVALFIAIGLILSTLAFPSLAYLEPRKSDRVVVSALNEIPSNASVSVMPEFFPHICNRLDAYPYFKQGVDYVLIDVYSWWYTATLPRPADSAPKWSAANVSVDYGIMINSNGILLYKRGYKGPVVFEGVSGEYGGHDVTVATGGFSRDNITIGNSIVTVDVLLHGTADNGPLFFYTSPTVFPPGIYNVTALMRASSVTSAEVVSFLVTEEPEHAEIHSERINGTAFTPQGAWGNLMFSFALEKPAPIMISVYVSNSTQVYFYSMKYSQVSGGM